MSADTPEIEHEMASGAVYAFQITGGQTILHVGIPKGQSRPAMWMTAGGRAVMIASFHGLTHAALMVWFLNIHSDAVQAIINNHRREKNG